VSRIFRFIPKYEKRVVNGKNIYSFMLQLLLCRKMVSFAVQMDNDLWLKPRRIRYDKAGACGGSIGWLFIQFGYLKFN
jgi:hypothetical protein